MTHSVTQCTIHAVLFDLDGTLVDTAVELANAFNYAFVQFNFPTQSIDSFRELISEGTYKMIETCTGITRW